MLQSATLLNLKPASRLGQQRKPTPGLLRPLIGTPSRRRLGGCEEAAWDARQATGHVDAVARLGPLGSGLMVALAGGTLRESGRLLEAPLASRHSRLNGLGHAQGPA